jgi:hypothetical protein
MAQSDQSAAAEPDCADAAASLRLHSIGEFANQRRVRLRAHRCLLGPRIRTLVGVLTRPSAR